MTLIVRPAKADDQDFLWAMLYESLFVAPGEEPYPESLVRTEPKLAGFVEGFGTNDHDHGTIAVDGGQLIGAAWVRVVAD